MNTFPSPKSGNGSVLISAQNASFAWEVDGKAISCDANFNLYRRKFTFVIGPVGSGKSTILKGLLGETPSSKGFVYSNAPSTGFVAQTPWVRNGTVQ